MGKKKRGQKKIKHLEITTKGNNFISKIQLSDNMQLFVFIGIVILILLFLLKPMIIDGLIPQGVDWDATRMGVNQLKEYEKKSSEPMLWSPYYFAGSPRYYGLSPVAKSVDNLIFSLGKLINGIFAWYLFGAIGMYLFLRYLKLSPVIAFLGALLFILMPHFKSIWVEGHYRKFRAIMIIPWTALSFRYFLTKRNMLGAALFAIFWGIQIRTQHYQIVFYTALLIFSMGVYPFIKTLSNKEWKNFAIYSTLLAMSISAALLLSSQPLFLAKEYLPYSKRGKTTVDIFNPRTNNNLSNISNKQDGVSFDYATQWSTHPTELFTWVLPSFYGGMSAEIYNGKRYPHLKGRALPLYWGNMRFTQSSEYFGILTILLAAIGIYWNRKKPFIRSICIFGIFLILLSFGRFFSSFYNLFFEYLPYFNKFRAPMMGVTMNYFIVAILASLGLQALKDNFQEFKKEEIKIIYYFIGAFLLLGILLLAASQFMSFVKSNQQYDQNTIEIIRNIRYDNFLSDIFRYFLILIITAGILLALIKKKLKMNIVIVLIILISLIDLITVQNRKKIEYISIGNFNKRHLKLSPTDKYIKKDTDLFRIFPVGQLFNDMRWGAFHQSIGGYSPKKISTIEEIIQNNLYHGWEKTLPINWNILQMLNVKYLILSQAINHDKISLINIDKQNSLYTYKFNEFLPRGYFVGKTMKIKDIYDRLKFMNTPEFKPAKFAIVETELPDPIYTPNQHTVDLLSFTPNKIDWDIYTDKQSLFYISETYYPPGWKAFLDGNRIEIYKTNHNNMSVIISKGNHKFSLVFDPDSYAKYVTIERITAYLLYALILGLFIYQNKTNLLNYIKKIKK